MRDFLAEHNMVATTNPKSNFSTRALDILGVDYHKPPRLPIRKDNRVLRTTHRGTHLTTRPK